MGLQWLAGDQQQITTGNNNPHSNSSTARSQSLWPITSSASIGRNINSTTQPVDRHKQPELQEAVPGAMTVVQHQCDLFPLLSYSVQEVLLFRSPLPSQRLLVAEGVVWAGMGEGSIVTVHSSGLVERWLPGGTRLASIPPPASLGTPPFTAAGGGGGGIGGGGSGPVTCATLLHDGRTVVLGGDFPQLVLCSLEHSGDSRTVALPDSATTGPPVSAAALLAIRTSHHTLRQVLLVLTNQGSLHLLSAAGSLLRTLQSPKLTVESVCASKSGDWLALSYSNNMTKLYPTLCLLPHNTAPLTYAGGEPNLYGVMRNTPAVDGRGQRGAAAVDGRAQKGDAAADDRTQGEAVGGRAQDRAAFVGGNPLDDARHELRTTRLVGRGSVNDSHVMCNNRGASNAMGAGEFNFTSAGNGNSSPREDGRERLATAAADEEFLISENMTRKVHFDVAGFEAAEDDEERKRMEEDRRAGQDKLQLKLAAKKVKRAVSSLPQWRLVLEEFGSFPDGQRSAVWCGLLRLPRCAAIHSALSSKRRHAAVRDYSAMQDEGLREAFTSTLSCLYYWAPALATVTWIPGFVFPFVKFLQNSPLVCFELCVALIVSWCRDWFSPPSQQGAPSLSPCLPSVEVLVCDASPRLMARLVGAHVTAEVYAWPLMATAFAQVLSPEHWLVAWDHILCQPPSFLLCLTAAFSLCLQPTILAAETPQQIASLYSQETFLPVRSLLHRAYEVQGRLQEEVRRRLDRITPFPKGGLPVFSGIPEVEVLEESGPDSASVGWALEDEEIERQRSELYGREEVCLAELRAVRRKHLLHLHQYTRSS